MTRISRPRSGPPSAAITSSIGLLAGVIWLALPELALANDCFTAGEVLDCVLTTPPILFGLLGAALLGAALWGAMGGPPPPDDLKDTRDIPQVGPGDREDDLDDPSRWPGAEDTRDIPQVGPGDREDDLDDPSRW